MKLRKVRTWLFSFTCLGLISVPAGLRAANIYVQHKLVSDIPSYADLTDPGLINPWGIAESPTGPFWFADNGSGVSTLYSTKSSGSIPGLIVTVAATAGETRSHPTGIVFHNPTAAGFEVATGSPAVFIFDTEDGTIVAWASGTTSVIKVDNSAAGAIYKGLAIGVNGTNTFLYAANFHAGTIEIYDSNYAPVAAAAGAFTDPMVPAGYAPFNIQNLNGSLYVTYALQDSAKQDDMPGAGNGYVAIYDTAGTLKQHFIAGGHLNSPWGLAIAPAGFGDYANDLLVGNFGDGQINVYDPTTGAYIATLKDTTGATLSIQGLWGLQAGNGGSGGDKNTVYFTAGIGGPNGTKESHGLFGSLQAAPVITTTSVVNGASFQPGIAPNTYITITGANLSSTTRTWGANDFANGNLPTGLDGVSVSVNGKPAYVYYISPTQLNVLAPADTTQGAVDVKTTNGTTTSPSISVTLQNVAPAFFLFTGGKYIAATHADGSYIGPTTLFPGASTPAKPGETIVLYGNGFGPTDPATPDGKLITAPLNLATTPIVLIGNAPATVKFAGLTAAGLYQINVVVPASTPDGDAAVVAQAGGLSSPSALITIQH